MKTLKIITLMIVSTLFIGCSQTDNESSLEHYKVGAQIDISSLDESDNFKSQDPLLDKFAFADLEVGKHYEILDKRYLFDNKALKPKEVEIVQVFGYSCVYCYDLNKVMIRDNWKDKYDNNVSLVYIAAPYEGVWNDFAKVYYASQNYAERDDIHNKIFELVHDKKAFARAKNKGIARLVSDNLGIDKEGFLRDMESERVQIQIDRAIDYLGKTNVDGTPTIIVDGRYKIINQNNWSDTLQISKLISDHIIQGDQGDRIGLSTPDFEDDKNLLERLPESDLGQDEKTPTLDDAQIENDDRDKIDIKNMPAIDTDSAQNENQPKADEVLL